MYGEDRQTEQRFQRYAVHNEGKVGSEIKPFSLLFKKKLCIANFVYKHSILQTSSGLILQLTVR